MHTLLNLAEVLLSFQEKRRANEQQTEGGGPDDASLDDTPPVTSSAANGCGDAPTETTQEEDGDHGNHLVKDEDEEDHDEAITPRAGLNRPEVGEKEKNEEEEIEGKEDKLVVEEKKGVFVDVFSDTESEGESER